MKFNLTLVEEEESEEEKQKKLIKEKAKVEYFAAIEEEGIVKNISCALLR